MPKRIAVIIGLGIALMHTGALAQDVRPLAPVLQPADADRSEEGSDEPSSDRNVVPLPEAPSRAAAASRDRVRVTSVLPSTWTGVAAQYQPAWTGITPVNSFGFHQWAPYYAAAGLVPVVAPHPFFTPWGLLSYEGWVFSRYRALWTSTQSDDGLAGVADLLQRGDRAMIEERTGDAVFSYQRVTQEAPGFALGYFALGAALAEMGEDENAATAFRQGLDRYPAWLALTVDWPLLFGDSGRLEAVQNAATQRAQTGTDSSQLVAGVLHLFGDSPATGRAILQELEPDPHAEILLARGPR